MGVDSEDLGTLGQMMALGSQYIAEQDDPGDQANVPKMEGVLSELTGLAQYEASETEPADEPEDE